MLKHSVFDSKIKFSISGLFNLYSVCNFTHMKEGCNRAERNAPVDDWLCKALLQAE